jgi:uncharacterized membrane protein YdjX (TVP38/TMEM64 family)
MREVRTIVHENPYSLLFLTVIFGSLYLSQTLSINTQELVGENRLMSAGMLAGVMFISTVLAPITVLPMVPVIAPLLGPFTTGLASWIGWTLGAVAAFLIARHGGRPLLHRFIDIEKLTKYESRLPNEAHFFLVLALRLILPVDLLSYALGIFSTVKTTTYTLASGLGILWFSFAFAYLGYAFDSGNAVLFATYGVASLIIFGAALAYVGRSLRKS